MHSRLKFIDLSTDLHKNHKTKILNGVLNRNSCLAPQGSEEWLALRPKNIGGSEVSTLSGDNLYQKVDTLVAIKLGLITFKGNIMTRWGNLFEPVTDMLTGMLLRTEIKETGSLEGAVPHQRYSPDGLAVVKILCKDIIDDEEIEKHEWCLVLFEYKAPYSSIPHGVVPKHYLPQVKTGLCSIPETDFAIFISNMYRKCHASDMNLSNKYDTDFHTGDLRKKVSVETPLALGYILFYQTPEQKEAFYAKYKEVIDYKETDDDIDSDTDYESDCENIFANMKQRSAPISYDININMCKFIHRSASTSEVRDFGGSYYRDMNDLFKWFDDGLISVNYMEPHFTHAYNNNPLLEAQEIKVPENKYQLSDYMSIIETKKDEILGYLPWKLFKSDMVFVKRTPNYIENMKDEIKKIIDIIAEINEADTEREKIEMFKSYFPRSKVLKNHGVDNSHLSEFAAENN